MLGGSDNVWTFKSKNGEPLNLTVKGDTFAINTTTGGGAGEAVGWDRLCAPYYSLATELAAGQLVPLSQKERCIDLQAWLIFQRRDILPCAYRRYSTASAPISKNCLICCFKLRARWPAQDPAAGDGVIAVGEAHLGRGLQAGAHLPGAEGSRKSGTSCARKAEYSGYWRGLPCGMPGIGDDIEGAMQHAPQSVRHSTTQLPNAHFVPQPKRFARR